ncbi:MAG TPA: hypothetical protein VI776_12620 [Anaerolineales bacterium]|jgi:hypothetical protein|nr:hypothetical protein [Anaerolineales bacterium]
MAETVEKTGDAPLVRYTMASGDMRYIEVAEREIYLRDKPQVGPVVRGEIPGCGDGCFADLSQVFLEYAMSCEGCKEESEAEDLVVRFGVRLGGSLAARLARDLLEKSAEDQMAWAFECLLRSMSVPFEVRRTEDYQHYLLAFCPLCDAGRKTGLSREMTWGRKGLVALSEQLVADLAPGWHLLKPTRQEAEETLLEFVLVRS